MLSFTRWHVVLAFFVFAAASAGRVGGQTRCTVSVNSIERRDVPRFKASARRDSGYSQFADNTTCAPRDAAQDEGNPDVALWRGRPVRPILPRLRTVVAGGLPAAAEDGALWAGRGASVALRGGLAFDAGILHLALVPEIATSENAAFDHQTSNDPSRSSFASPYHVLAGGSIDLPKRLGADRYDELSLGSSAVWVTAGGVSGGFSASPQQWGPGQRGSLLLGAAASGIPRLFLRTAAPLQTGWGVIDAVLFLGVLTESRFFDRTSDNDYRSLSALGLSWSPSLRSAFTVGLARGVQRASANALPDAGRLADAVSPGNNERDEMISAFAKLGRASDALSAWVEVARDRPGFGLRSFLTLPYDATSYVVGARGVAGLRRGQLVVLAEAANLEQGEDVIGRAPKDFYTGNATLQGWTQRGRPIGHWVGPGGQSQFLAIDWVGARSSAGLFAERVRRDEDALFREYLAYPNRHDVSLQMGVRSALAWRGQEFAVEGSIGRRINFEFQNSEYLPTVRTVDIAIPQLRFSVTPLSQR